MELSEEERDVCEFVPNASITVINPQIGAERSAKTNDEGVFAIPEVPSGTYNVRVEAANFKTTNVAAVIVEVGTPASLNVTMETGSVSEEVTISASDAQEVVNTTNAEIGDVVDRRRVLDLPLDGRNPLDLITLQAGASDTGPSNFAFRGLAGQQQNPLFNRIFSGGRRVGDKLDLHHTHR